MHIRSLSLPFVKAPESKMPSSLFSARFIVQALALIANLPYAGAGPSGDVWSRLLSPCPRDCGETSSPAEWAVYKSLYQLSTCNQTTRVAFSLYNPSPGIRACSTSTDVLPVKAAIADILSKNFAAEKSDARNWLVGYSDFFQPCRREVYHGGCP